MNKKQILLNSMSNKANFVCLDIGSNKIAALAANVFYENKFHIVNASLHASEGFKCAEITNFEQAEKSISNVLNSIEQKLEFPVDSVSVIFSC